MLSWKGLRSYRNGQGCGSVGLLLSKWNIEDFGGMIGDMDDYISHSSFRKKTVILGGDLNAKLEVVGSEVSNERGRVLEDWIAARNFTVLNQGNTHTFRRGTG